MDSETTTQPKTNGNRRPSPLVLIIGAVVVIAAAFWLVRTLSFAFTHQTTDDAYLTGNTVDVGPMINGTLTQLLVNEGDHVKRGQLIARLDDTAQRAALRQAQAALDAAQSQVPEAADTVAYQQEATSAGLKKAQADYQAQLRRTAGSKDLVELSRETTANQIEQAKAQLSASKDKAKEADSDITQREDAARVARSGIGTAKAGLQALKARELGARSDVRRTQADVARYKDLLRTEAVTKQQYDAVVSAADNAQSALASLQSQISQAETQVQSAILAADQADSSVQVAKQSAAAAHRQVDVARAGVELAKAGKPQVKASRATYEAAISNESGSQAEVASASANQKQVDVSKDRLETAKARVRQALAERDNAKVQFDYTYVYAPCDGQVVRKSTNIGASVGSGQTLVVIAQDDAIWVTANFKETQIGSMVPGQKAEIEVDALPGKKFEAVVASINLATGASTSLLPPDNATGNFTKVVQRVPVRLAIIPGDSESAKADYKLLRIGLSVNAIVETTDKTPHPDRVPANYSGDPAVIFPHEAGQQQPTPNTQATR